MSGLRFDLLGGWLCGSCGFAVDTATGCDCQADLCDSARVALPDGCVNDGARSYGLGEPRATGAAWADDGLDDLSAAECDMLERVMWAVASG